MKKIFLLIMLVTTGFATIFVACKKENDNNKQQEAALLVPTGTTKYLKKSLIITDGDTLPVECFVLSGNGLILSDTSYSWTTPSKNNVFISRTKTCTYGAKGVVAVDVKQYNSDGSLNEESWVETYTYSGDSIIWTSSYDTYLYKMEGGGIAEGGRVVKRTELGDGDVDYYFYLGTDVVRWESHNDGSAEPTSVRTNTYDNKKNPLAGNWLVLNIRHGDCGEHNLLKQESTNQVYDELEYEYNEQGYPTKFTDRVENRTYLYKYIGW